MRDLPHNFDSDFTGDDAAMDRLLRAAMQARPEPSAATDLAARALARAKQADQVLQKQMHRLAVRRWQMRLISLAALILIGIILGVGGVEIARLQRNNIETAFSNDTSTSTSSQTTSSTETTLTSNSTNALWIGGCVLIVALAGLAAERMLSSNRTDPASLIWRA